MCVKARDGRWESGQQRQCRAMAFSTTSFLQQQAIAASLDTDGLKAGSNQVWCGDANQISLNWLAIRTSYLKTKFSFPP